MTVKDVYFNIRILMIYILNINNSISKQNYKEAMQISHTLMTMLESILEFSITNKQYFNEEYCVIDETYINEMLGRLMESQNNEDYILFNDLLNAELLTFLQNNQWVLCNKERDLIQNDFFQRNIDSLREVNPELADMVLEYKLIDNDKYQFEPNSLEMGTILIQDDSKKFYLNSQVNPWKEGRDLIKSNNFHLRNNIIVFGFGAGYHIGAIIYNKPEIVIDVYESNMNVLKLVLMNIIEWKMLNWTNLRIHYDPDCQQFIQVLSENEKKLEEEKDEVFIYKPSVRAIENLDIRRKINEFIQYLYDIERYKPILQQNFNYNIKHYDKYVDELGTEFQGKTVYIVAAGPSLDKNVELLKQVSKDAIILATGTVLKKLLALGINPDYVIISDPNPSIYWQIAGEESSDVPMLFLSTALNKMIECYQGKKYLICQREYILSEEYAAKKGYNLYNTGGSVSTTALDVSISLGCKRIVFLGLDLSYPNDFAHAEDTSIRDVALENGFELIPSIDGGMIKTSSTFILFKHWIENRILNVPGVEFIDATEGGALIKGMKIRTLAEVLKERPLD